MLPAYLLLTALAAQFIYILVNWYFFRRKEYVYYSGYILFVSLYFLNKYLANSNGIVNLGFLQYYKLYPDKVLSIISYFFYFKFGRHFVEASTRYPKMNKLMTYCELFLFFFIIIDIILLLSTGNFILENYIFLPVNIAIFIVLIYVFRAMIIRNEALDRFILTGSMFYAICACITMWLGQNKSPLDDNHILVLQIGAIVELILLNAGLVYKSRMLQNLTLKSQNELIEKYAENQELLLRLGNIREKITRDLHDDVGATLSSVKAYAEILKNNQENPAIAELIKDNAAEMIERLEVIAWATNPVHDNFGSLKNRMIKFITPLCHAKKMSCKVESKGIDDGLDMSGEFRQNIFLVFKEAVNNTIKYANASDCSASMFIENRNFILQISDNGHGSDGTVKGSGTGWKNMQKRAEELKGQLKIASVPGKGTTITFSVPYPFKIPNTWDKKGNGMN